jgi:hypothetical protein
MKECDSVVVELVCDGEPAAEGVDNFIGCQLNAGDKVKMVALSD